MKTKRFIYLGLAILLSSASLTNLPTRVSAAESSSSSVSSSQSSNSKESTTATSESSQSKSSQSVMLSSSSSQQSATAEQAQPNAKATGNVVVDDPPAPTEANGVQKADWDGWFFIIPIITGFRVQPQAEQYVVAGSNGKGTADLSFGASMVAGLPIVGTSVSLEPTKWTWTKADPNLGTVDHWAKRDLAKYNSKNYTGGNPTVANDIKDLAIGTYYFQFRGGFNGWIPIIGTDYKISKLSKVVVVAEPIDAKTITPDVPSVMFENVNYDGKATTAPTDATGTIKWTSALGGLTFNQDTGRNANFTFKGQSTIINRSTVEAGIPAKFRATITNTGKAPGTRYGDDNAMTGGLVAKEMAADAGGTWALDTDGLASLEQAVNPSNGTGVSWDYQWQYSTNNGGKFVDVPDNTEGVTNDKGSVTNANELGTSGKPLTFDKTSAFIQDAAKATAGGTDYVLREVLTAHVTDPSGGGKDQKISINSNIASLKVTPATGKLSLDKVPSFDFGSIPASQFYNGNTVANAPTATGDLTVSDTRAGSKDWKLQASATNFVSAEQTLKPVTFQLTNVLGATDSKDLTTGTTNLTTISDNTTGTVGTSKVSAKMLITGNPTIQMKNNESFANLITWTLSSTQPTALAAK